MIGPLYRRLGMRVIRETSSERLPSTLSLDLIDDAFELWRASSRELADERRIGPLCHLGHIGCFDCRRGR